MDVWKVTQEIISIADGYRYHVVSTRPADKRVQARGQLSIASPTGICP